MLKIIIIILAVGAVSLGFFFWFNNPKTGPENPLVENLGKILGFSEDTRTGGKTDNLIDKTKDSFEENSKKTIDTAKTNLYDSAKTALDNVFDKQDSSENKVQINIVTGEDVKNTNAEYTIDLSKDTNLNLSLSVNKKYYLKFKNLPNNYCLYINGNKYALNDDVVEIQFTKGGSYPIKTNSCDLNDKNIGNITVQ